MGDVMHMKPQRTGATMADFEQNNRSGGRDVAGTENDGQANGARFGEAGWAGPPAHQPRRVVITGLGAITSLAPTAAETW